MKISESLFKGLQTHALKSDIAFASRTLFYLASYFDSSQTQEYGNFNISQVGNGTHPVRSMGTAGKNSRTILHAALPYMYDSISEITASIMQAIKVSLDDHHVLSIDGKPTIDCYPIGIFDDFAQGVAMVWQRSADTRKERIQGLVDLLSEVHLLLFFATGQCF